MTTQFKVFLLKFGQCMLMHLYKSALSVSSSRVFGRRRLNILNYHRVLPKHDVLQPDYVTVEQFKKEMRWLSEHCLVLPLSQAVMLLKHDKLPRRAVSVTFDDGYSDNYLDALPVLQAYKLPATFFVTTEYLKSPPKWDVLIESVRNTSLQSIVLNKTLYSLGSMEEKAYFCGAATNYLKTLQNDLLNLELTEIIQQLGKACLPNLMMNTDMLKSLSLTHNMEIGAHGVEHKILSKINTKEARDEITNSKNILESIVSKRIVAQAYPNGVYQMDFHDEHIDLVKQAGYSYAVSTDLGSVGPSDNLYRMSRIGPWRRDKAGFLLGLAMNYWREV